MNFKYPLQSKSGFTLIEILVVVAIVGLLSAFVAVNAVESGKQSRDAKRQSDLRAMQSAIELYKNKWGRYPEQCTPAVSAGANGWSGQPDTDYRCNNGTNRYIEGNTGRPFSEFMVTLPQDERLNDNNSGYIYRVNNNGTVYKLKAHRTVESDTIDFTHDFKACDIRVAHASNGGLSTAIRNRETIGWCGQVNFSGNSLPNQCRSNYEDWNSSYAVWGGFEAKTNQSDSGNDNPAVVRFTTNVICR